MNKDDFKTMTHFQMTLHNITTNRTKRNAHRNNKNKKLQIDTETKQKRTNFFEVDKTTKGTPHHHKNVNTI